VLDTEYLHNDNIILKKRVKGEDFEIELHRFSVEEIEELKKSFELLYKELMDKRRPSRRICFYRIK
jgi:hypothetical protein